MVVSDPGYKHLFRNEGLAFYPTLTTQRSTITNCIIPGAQDLLKSSSEY